MMKNEQENRNEKLTLYDGILAALYVIIIAIGIVMCATHGLGGTLTHLVIISLCICGVFAVKLIKYRSSLKAHISELIFIGALSVGSVVTIIGTVL